MVNDKTTCNLTPGCYWGSVTSPPTAVPLPRPSPSPTPVPTPVPTPGPTATFAPTPGPTLTPRPTRAPRRARDADATAAICAGVLGPLAALFCCAGGAFYYRRRARGGGGGGGPRLPRMGERLTQLKSMRSAGGLTDEEYWRDYQLILNRAPIPGRGEAAAPCDE